MRETWFTGVASDREMILHVRTPFGGYWSYNVKFPVEGMGFRTLMDKVLHHKWEDGEYERIVEGIIEENETA